MNIGALNANWIAVHSRYRNASPEPLTSPCRTGAFAIDASRCSSWGPVGDALATRWRVFAAWGLSGEGAGRKSHRRPPGPEWRGSLAAVEGRPGAVPSAGDQ